MDTGYAVAKKRFVSALEDIKKVKGNIAERIITTPQGADIVTNKSLVLNFSANNYLGLANHPKIKEGAIKFLETHGFGMGSVRFICGTQDIHKKLEKELAEFTGMEGSILFSSCFDANGAVFEALLTNNDAVISDELNHASIIDGIRLCKAKRLRYKHMDMKDLEECLKKAAECPIKLIVTDAVFSMDGDLAPLPEILQLAKKYGALVMLDEAHSSGVFGKTGRGVTEYFGVMGQVDIITSTLGKALGGGTGGFIAARKEIVDLIRVKGRPYLFSNSVPPPIIGGAFAAFKILKESPQLVTKLHENTKRFRTKMTEAGFKLLGNPECPICPVLLYDGKFASEIAEELLKLKIYVISFSFPVVPRGLARIRIQISAAHSFDQIDKCVEAFTKIAKAKGILSAPKLQSFDHTQSVVTPIYAQQNKRANANYHAISETIIILSLYYRWKLHRLTFFRL
eukprot:TRINITY_DN2026_c0_g1_i1.p1 TRINITY_DN2026_c0_g1~~TRINITY_DN2026_c0_g1_i1.p1  ORF type:complete len:455 (+),score=53.85 TRINITY_DN2026_c0_g1_i1:96-1460(+)